MIEVLDRTILLCRDYVADTVTDSQIVQVLQQRVLCIADDRTVRSHSGQSALLTLVALLGRMGMNVNVYAPDAPLIGSQVPFQGKTLHAALSNTILAPGCQINLGENADCDMSFVVGVGHVDRDIPVWWLNGTEWSGVLTDEHRAVAWEAEWPIGAMVSALLAAGEAFKHVVRQLPVRFNEDREFFAATTTCGWTFEPVELPDGPLELGRVDIVSAGAITQAALFALLRIPNLTLHGRIFDNDSTAVSNLNRNMLSLASDIGTPKVELVARRSAPQIHLEPISRRFTSTDVPLAERVLVGVDDIPSRWEVQRYASGWVGVSGTSHFSVSSSAHRKVEACSGCLHPIDDDSPDRPIPTVAFVSFWAGLSLAVRYLREALNQPYAPHQQQLWLSPLRMDLRHAAMWAAVPANPTCPVGCAASGSLR